MDYFAAGRKSSKFKFYPSTMVERPMGDCESERSEKGFWGETVAYHKEFVDAIFRMDCWGKTERSIVRLPDVNGQNLIDFL
jgi:hypothetical protein